ncbi:hypothetical protein [Halalkalirubrum salinum]|uniref:hypothetical protein n=1 Tax=Halalkalirubrum salinum TaxID=2563889 RepID=UPI0010FB17A9|nr:hypothetical protein [Halalkalirubrum salinum]
MLKQFREELTDGPLGEVWYRTKSRTSCRERIAVFVVVPVLLLIVAALPQPVKEAWTLHLGTPSLIEAYLTNFVHGGLIHLGNNLLSYVFLMAVLLPLAVFADWKRELYVTSFFFIAVVPFIVSYYSVWTLQGTGVETTVGFSGVVAAFLGLLPILLFAFFQRAVSSNIRLHHALALVALELAVIFFSWYGVSTSVIALSMLGTLGLGLVWWDTRGDWKPLVSSNANLLLVFTTILVFTYVSYSIHANTGPNVNVYGHFIGFVSGFMFPGFLSLVLDLRERFTWIDDRLSLAV